MIETITQLCPSFTQRQIEFTAHTGYFLIGCSATNFRGKLVATTWASDHIYNQALGRYEQYTGNPNGRPGNPRSHRPPYLVSLSDNLDVTSVVDIHAPQFSPGGVDGLKPFEWGGQLWCDFYTGGYGSVRFFMARIEDGNLVAMRRLALPGPHRDEKNWMPEVHDGLRYHYDVSTLAHIGDNTVKLEDMGRPDFKNLHGGTQVVHGLGIVHDYRYEGPSRVYRHYFVRFGETGKPLALSRPFVLSDVERVEVVTGLAKHPDGKSLVISHGPFVATVALEEVWHMPWDGVPQPVPAHRPPPPTPSRSRPYQIPQIGGVRPRPRVGGGVRA